MFFKKHHHGFHKHHGMRERMMEMEIEKRASKIPAACFVSAAVGAMAVSLTLKCMKKKHSSLFVGQWAAPLLILGLYKKAMHKRKCNWM